MSNNGLFGQTNASGAGSLFGSTPVKGDAKPFSFSAAKPAETAPAGGASTNAFSLGSSKPNDLNAKPAFSFGTSNNDAAKPSPLFGGNSTTGNSSSGGFSFSKPDSNKPSGGLFGTVSGSDNKPANTFGGFGNTASKPAAASVPAPARTTTASFSFGNSEKKDTPASTTSFSFGAASKPEEKKDASSTFSFGASKPDEKKTNSFSFGPSTTTTTAEKKDESKSGFSFGSTTEKKDEAKPAFSFGAGTTEKKDEAKPGFSFGSGTTEKKEEPKPGFSLGAGTTEKKDENKPAITGFSFGGATKIPEKKDEPKSAGLSFGPSKTEEKKAEAKPAGFSFGGAKTEEKKEENKDKKTVSFSTSLVEKKDESKTIEPQPILLNNKTIEDIITKWTNQLTNTSSSFEEYSKKINEWDRVLVESGEKVSQLYTDVIAAEQSQAKVDQALLYIERQQNELETFLDNYETKTENLLSDVLSSSSQQRDSSVLTNDQKREQAYRTAELLDENLNSLGTNMSSLISEINDVSDSFNRINGLGASKEASKEEDESSLSQIVRLLSSHLDSLRFIESSSDELKAKLDKFRDVEL